MMDVLDNTTKLSVLNRISNEQFEKIQFGANEQRLQSNHYFGSELKTAVEQATVNLEEYKAALRQTIINC